MDAFEIIQITDTERNIYEIFHRLSCPELKRLKIEMNESEYKIYNLVRLQKCGNFGDLEKFTKLSSLGMQPILESFPSLMDGLAFIETFKPGFRYSRKFREILLSKLNISRTPLASGETIMYRLDNNTIRVDIRTGPGGTTIRTRYYENNRLHRVDGPADFTVLSNDGEVKILNEYYYENGINTNLL